MEFFVDKLDLIRESTIGAPPPIFPDYVGPTMDTFRSTTTEQLMKMIADASNKHCLLDPAPTFLVNTLLVVACAIPFQAFQPFSIRELRANLTESLYHHAVAEEDGIR